MAVARTQHGSRRALSEINVTPFVDVMLVLLVIFMVTAPMMQQGIDVDLPKTTTQPLRVKDDPLILTVKQDGTYLVGKSVVPSFFTVRISGSSCTRMFCVVVSGKSTSIPCSIMGAVTMKITSKTSITSTKGVTLISESAP